MIRATVNGTTVEVPEGASVLDACREAGVDVPTLCHGPTMTPANACRVCVVEMEGSRALVPSCSRALEEGMEIRTDGDRATHSRRLVLELLDSATELDRLRLRLCETMGKRITCSGPSASSSDCGRPRVSGPNRKASSA